MDPFLYIGKVSNLVSALEGQAHESVHQQDNIIVKEHGMEEIRDSLAQRLEQQKAKLDRINNHRRRILSIDNHWRIQEDQARNIISHGQSLLWAIDGTTQENENGTAS